MLFTGGSSSSSSNIISSSNSSSSRRHVIVHTSSFASLLLLALTAAAYYTTSKSNAVAFHTLQHACVSQSVYDGAYGAEAVANLSNFRSGLLSTVVDEFDSTNPKLKVRTGYMVGRTSHEPGH
jgi:hypothetical protein